MRVRSILRVAGRALPLAALLLGGTGCPILYGLSIEKEWVKGPVTRTAPDLARHPLQDIVVVNPFPKQWEGQWLYDGGEAERFSHILWQRMPDRHVYKVDLPIGVTPEQVEEALAAHDRGRVVALLGVDHPVDAVVVGRVREHDFENAYQQGFQTTREGSATAFDLDGQELWHAEASTKASVTHVTWQLASLLAESFPRR